MVIEKGKTILLDTNCFIYYFEDEGAYAEKLQNVFVNIQNGKNRAFMSVISMLEILVRPKREGNTFLQRRYKLLLNNYPNLSISDVTFEVAETAARLRAEYSIKTPDAIILATALQAGADYFLSNDVKLKDICASEGIGFLGLED